MIRNWIRSPAILGGIAALAASTAITVAVLNGRNRGTVIVGNVLELMSAIKSSHDCDTIVLSSIGSPYNLGEVPCMNGDGHLYVDRSITLRSETRNPYQVILVGTTNRILYVKSKGVKIEGITFSGGNCTTNNKVGAKTSHYSVWGGGIYFGLVTNDCKVLNCIFTNNIAARGGAMASYKPKDGSTIIAGCRFFANSADEHGGAVYNSGRMFNCLFVKNKATRYGGALYDGELNQGTSYDNEAMRGSELYECYVSRYVYSGDSTNKAPRFYNVRMDRSKLTITNGYAFSGYFDIRSSTITEGENFVLASSLKQSTEKRGFENYDEDGGTNYVYYKTDEWNPRLFNCTIANNQMYMFVKAEQDPTNKVELNNCLFYTNTVAQKEGIKVNWYLATNNCYKTVEMTRAQRLIALGWKGDSFNTDVIFGKKEISLLPDVYSESGDNWMSNLWKSIDVQYPNIGPVYTEVNYYQYFHALGWNGDTSLTSFMSKDIQVQIGDQSTSYANQYSTDLTWRDYYESEGWDGTSDYTGGEIQKADIGIDSIGMIQFAKGCIFNVTNSIIHSNCYFYALNNFNPGFAKEADVSNWYAIDEASPACHKTYMQYGITNIWSYPRETWLLRAQDLRGSPRLFGGGLDIGAYQAAVFYPFVMFIR